jgi:hypothetical protein
MEQHDIDEQIALGGGVDPVALEAQTQAQTQPQGPRTSNWRYFLHGHSIARRQEQVQNQPAVELQETNADGEEVGGEAVQQPRRSRWPRIWRTEAH